MGLLDHKAIIVLALALAYLVFFDNHQTHNQKFQIGQKHIIFHANWTKSLDDVCCLDKYKDSLSLTNIQSLDISFSMSSFSYQDSIKLFPQQFKQYKTLKIDVSSLPLGNKGIEHILSLIPNGVQNLQLGFNGIKTQDGIAKIISQKLNNLSTLKSLKISLIMAIKNTEVAEFLKSHKPSENLKIYHLVLIGNDINAQTLQHIQPYFNRIKLDQLVLNLYANKAGAQGAIYLANTVKAQTNLQQLTLDLYFNNITEVGTQNITQAISEMTQLKYLQLNFDFNYIKNEGGKAVGIMLPKMTNLEALNIGVASKNFGYLGFKDVLKGLQQLTQLKKLTLRCGINRVGYNGAQITKNMLQKLTNLEVLEIGFIQNYIGDDGIALIAQQVSKMTNLKAVYLNLAFNDAKSFGLIKVIKAFLKTRYDLLHISLSSNEFKDTDVKLIEQHLPTLINNNKKFVLQFSDTAISKAQVKRLETIWNESNKRFKKDSDLYVNSIIADQPQTKPQVNEPKSEQKKEAKVQSKQKGQTQKQSNKSATEL